MTHLSRRSFLSSSTKASVAFGLSGSAALLSVGPSVSQAIEPIARSSASRMKLSLAAYSLRNFLRRKPGEKGAIDLSDFIDYCVSLGIDGAELTQYYFPDPVDSAYILDLKRQAHIAGIDISGGAIGNNFTLEAGVESDEQMAYTKTWIDHYADLGAPVIRVFAGNPPAGVSVDQAIQYAVARLRVACEYASKRGVMLAIENHDFGTDIDRLMPIIEQVDSPWFGVNFDSGNFHQSRNPYQAMEKLAPYAVNVQLKTKVQGPDGVEPADFPRIIRILQDANYSGYVALEYEGDYPYVAIPRHLDQIRKLIDA